MVAYTKPWLSIEQQILQLRSRGLIIDDPVAAAHLLEEVGYYRLTGYLYPARVSEKIAKVGGRVSTRILSSYRPGTHFEHASELIVFDRKLRLHILDAVERIEVSLRTQMGHILGRKSAFAHLEVRHFTPTFIAPYVDEDTGRTTSKHSEWVLRVDERRASSKEAFVDHFRQKYDNQMPIWALTEILELGQLATLYRGLQNDVASEIAAHYSVPSKTLFTSWLASINYVRNVAAHQSRLFNRKLVVAPSRPKGAQIPLLSHLGQVSAPKQDFGLYNALAAMAYLLGSISGHSEWVDRLREIVGEFPEIPFLGIESMGFAEGWDQHELWQ